MVKERFGKRVRELRIQSKMSQEKFALLINMDRTYLASVEKGKRINPLEEMQDIFPQGD